MFVTGYSGEEAIEDYAQDPDNPEDILIDPFRAGEPADPPVCDPRQYFLEVFASRVPRAILEYDRLLHYLGDEVAWQIDYYTRQWIFTPETPDAREASLNQIKAARNWVVKVNHLITKPIQSLSSIRNHWDAFRTPEQWQRYFGGLEQDAMSRRALRTMEETFTKSEVCLREFRDLQARVNSFRKEVRRPPWLR